MARPQALIQTPPARLDWSRPDTPAATDFGDIYFSTDALSAWPELRAYSDQLIAAWPGRVKGIHRLDFGNVTLTLAHEEAVIALDQLDMLKANAWFLDGFSPSGNPAMWSEDVMRGVANACVPGARLATFSVAGSVRTALKQAGFAVRKMPGFGRKRHRLEAEFPGEASTETPHIERALIVGAGIAGRSIARALDARHIPFDIIDNRAHPAASGNPAALVKPRFDLQDRPESRFFLSSYLHALRSYPEACILERGLRQIPKSVKEAERFQKLAQQSPLGEGHLDWREDALWIESACVIDPSKVFDSYGNPFELRAEDDAKNLSALESISGKAVTALPLTSRASVRVTTADTLPLMARTGENIWALTGLGSRGFTFAPQLAEGLVASLCGEVGPLEADLRTKFSVLK